MTPLRVVLDANVVVSALIRPDSAPGRILRLAVDGDKLRVLLSPPLLDELRRVMEYPRLQRFLKMSAKDKEEFLILLEQVTDPVNLAHHPAPIPCRDPDDEDYLRAAIAGRAHYIVSGDDDLLTLRYVENIPILAPADFERILGAAGSGL